MWQPPRVLPISGSDFVAVAFETLMSKYTLPSPLWVVRGRPRVVREGRRIPAATFVQCRLQGDRVSVGRCSLWL